MLYWKQVTILKGKESEKFLARMKNADLKEKQLVMAKVTGNFKHGNEKLKGKPNNTNYINIDETLRLWKFDNKYDFALSWYKDDETLRLVDGEHAEPYDSEKSQINAVL